MCSICQHPLWNKIGLMRINKAALQGQKIEISSA